jgi:hypothetical protein
MRQFLVLISVFVLAADSNACGQATAVFPGEKSVGINIPGTKTTVFDDDGFLTITLAAKECISRFNYPQTPVFTSSQVKCAEENKSVELLLLRTPPDRWNTYFEAHEVDDELAKLKKCKVDVLAAWKRAYDDRDKQILKCDDGASLMKKAQVRFKEYVQEVKANPDFKKLGKTVRTSHIARMFATDQRMGELIESMSGSSEFKNANFVLTQFEADLSGAHTYKSRKSSSMAGEDEEAELSASNTLSKFFFGTDPFGPKLRCFSKSLEFISLSNSIRWQSGSGQSAEEGVAN